MPLRFRSLALALGLLAAPLGLTPATASAAAGACAPSASAAGQLRLDLAADALRLINAHRARLGLGTLVESGQLRQIAQWKSEHMLDNGYLEHADPSPVSRTAAERIRECGFTGARWGENLARGQASAGQVVSEWLASPAHRSAIEGTAYTVTGIGVIVGPGGDIYWTQVFGSGPVVAASTEGSSPTAQPRADSASSTSRTVAKTRKLTTRRRALVRPGRARAFRLRATPVASRVVLSARLAGRGSAAVVLRCPSRRRATRVAPRRMVNLRLAVPSARGCRVVVRAVGAPVRVSLRAITR